MDYIVQTTAVVDEGCEGQERATSTDGVFFPI